MWRLNFQKVQQDLGSGSYHFRHLLHVALQLTPPLLEELPACIQQTLGWEFWHPPIVRFLQLKGKSSQMVHSIPVILP